MASTRVPDLWLLGFLILMGFFSCWSCGQVLGAFGVDPAKGLKDAQVAEHAKIYGRNGKHSCYSMMPLWTVPFPISWIDVLSFFFMTEIFSYQIGLIFCCFFLCMFSIICSAASRRKSMLLKVRLKRKKALGTRAVAFVPSRQGTPLWKLILKQFDDLLVKILIAAAIISFFLALVNGETGLTAFLEPSVIFMILAANATVGVITETNAEKALEELRAYQADVATVLRNGCFSIIPASELVPGDIVEVGGESCSVAKDLESTLATNAVYQDKTNILFSGTVVVVGRARAVVVGVGSNTAMGSIRDAMLRTEDEMTPLKKKLDEFGTFLAKVIAGICVLVWVVNIGHFQDPSHGGFLRGAIHYFKIAVALAVAAIPEGLPAVVTTCLALGTKRMARLNAIVRSLPSVEALGCTTVICSDKTGTLTTNMMSVSKICVVQSVHRGPITNEYIVSGTTFAPEGLIFDAAGVQATLSLLPLWFYDILAITMKTIRPCPLIWLEFPAQFPCLLHIAMCSALCNDSILQYNPDKRNYEKIGESTEVALRVLVEKVGLPGFDSMPSALNMLSKHERASYCNRYWEHQFKKISVLEFSRDRKLMSVLCSRKQQEIMFSKGAPESIISRCTHILCNDDGSSVPLTVDIRNELVARFQRFIYIMKEIILFVSLWDVSSKDLNDPGMRRQHVKRKIKGKKEKDLGILVFLFFFWKGINSFAGKDTLRCLALALKRMPMGQQTLCHEDEANLTFIGLVGMLDPPREEVRNAMLSCMSAGIRVIVVTGDNKHLDDFTGYSYTASEFEELPPMQRTLALQRMVLFTRYECLLKVYGAVNFFDSAQISNSLVIFLLIEVTTDSSNLGEDKIRVEPSHKKMLVEALQNQREVVAMTGDGVNDAPALKKADIGIAMGSGTAVAKSAADMVLADDNFASIVAAVAEGRAIYNNTKQFIRYMISSNIGEVVCIFVAAVLGMPDTLVPVQLLWVNLVTDGLPATAIGFNKPDTNVMMAKPRKASNLKNGDIIGHDVPPFWSLK
ncbi:Calcium-transporting ATPase [Cocos nucifera]|uniref:Calcium-transporting ATPase n=1 Tax=Cocos nucifera TaxID=13894 RepID=A0A8K0I7K1_COCNU|nr:Calcium-transporting ATPase [Cocos nucifera]